MSNILSFEKFAEFAPIESLLENMKNYRLYSEVDGAIRNLEQATSNLNEAKPETVASSVSEVMTLANTESRTPRTPSEPQPTEVGPAIVATTPEVPNNTVSLEDARAAIAAIHAKTDLQFEVPEELEAA